METRFKKEPVSPSFTGWKQAATKFPQENRCLVGEPNKETPRLRPTHKRDISLSRYLGSLSERPVLVIRIQTQIGKGLQTVVSHPYGTRHERLPYLF